MKKTLIALFIVAVFLTTQTVIAADQQPVPLFLWKKVQELQQEVGDIWNTIASLQATDDALITEDSLLHKDDTNLQDQIDSIKPPASTSFGLSDIAHIVVDAGNWLVVTKNNGEVWKWSKSTGWQPREIKSFPVPVEEIIYFNGFLLIDSSGSFWYGSGAPLSFELIENIPATEEVEIK